MVLLIGGAEKMLQHLFTALFFLVDIPGVGIPDIGDRFAISAPAMGVLNTVYGAAFALAFVAAMRHRRAGVWALFGLALFDIVLEFSFHGPFFFTVSVLVSLVVSVSALIVLRSDKMR